LVDGLDTVEEGDAFGGNGGRPEQARERVEEAQLFIEAAYKCYEKIGTAGAPA
jgi:hypothetical protein